MTEVLKQFDIYSESVESIRMAEKVTEDARSVFVAAAGEDRKNADAALGSAQIAERVERKKFEN